MRCVDCFFYYKTEEDEFPCCQFEGPIGWAPCEQEEEYYEEDED